MTDTSRGATNSEDSFTVDHAVKLRDHWWNGGRLSEWQIGRLLDIACKAQSTPSASATPINQCDGCARGLPVRETFLFPRKARELGESPIHYDTLTGLAIMACTADRYINAPSGDKRSGETPRTDALMRSCGPVLMTLDHPLAIMLEHARQLERELAETLAKYERCQRSFVAAQEREAARSATARSLDTQRMDWLQGMTVEVRLPLAHGSQHLFYATPDQGDGEETPSDIRKQIDEQAGLVASASTTKEKA